MFEVVYRRNGHKVYSLCCSQEALDLKLTQAMISPNKKFVRVRRLA